jgi:hypothetical protein
MRRFASHPFFEQLFSLDLPREDFAVAGSGPLFVRGLIDELSDVDIIARRGAWKVAIEHGRPSLALYSTVQIVELFDKNVEILDGWFPEIWSVDDLIDGADLIDGLRFVSLEVVRQTKEIMGRPKDIAHLQIIDKYLAHGPK